MSNFKNNLEIEYRLSNELIPYANNSRTHSDEQVTQIASSIREFGFNNPILIDEFNSIIAGHGRLMAAKKLKLEKVPTIKLIGLTEAQRKAYIIADNKIALNSGWNDELLQLELEDIGDLIEFTGFDESEINLIFNGWDSDVEIPDEIPDMNEMALIKIKTDKHTEAMAKERIENVLQSLGIEYELA